MISKKIEGTEATHHENRLDIIEEVDCYASVIHTIPTTGFGHMFDWSQNTLSKNQTWKDYLDCELNVTERQSTLLKYKMLSEKSGKSLTRDITKIKKWNQSPCLHHGDLQLKNIMVMIKQRSLPS